jgi:UDP-N-acetylmuramoyl-tripeptide--D-alanyl-D-alanine ligase
MMRRLSEFAAAMGGTLSGADAEFAAVCTDSRSLRPGELFVALAGPRFDGHSFIAEVAAKGAAGAVVSRRLETALPQIVVADVLDALQAGAVAWRAQWAGPLVGVGGSNGKTTTKELLAAILGAAGPCRATRGNLNNHIGVPLTLLTLEPSDRSAVVEMGANGPGEIAALVALARPTIGLVTNAGAEHLEGFGNLDGVAAAEGELYAGLPAQAMAIINADDDYAGQWRRLASPRRTLSFGLARPADVRASALCSRLTATGVAQAFRLHTPSGECDIELTLAGRHSVLNALAAAAAAHAAGTALEHIQAGLARARAVKGRLQFLSGAQGARLLDDSYNANPSSLAAGLEVVAGLPGERWLVLGDMGELGVAAAAAHAAAGDAARAAGVTRLFAIGALTERAVESFGPGGEWFESPDALAARVRPLLRAGVTVLVKGSRLNRLERIVAALAPEQLGVGS